MACEYGAAAVIEHVISYCCCCESSPSHPGQTWHFTPCQITTRKRDLAFAHLRGGPVDVDTFSMISVFLIAVVERLLMVNASNGVK